VWLTLHRTKFLGRPKAPAVICSASFQSLHLARSVAQAGASIVKLARCRLGWWAAQAGAVAGGSGGNFECFQRLSLREMKDLGSFGNKFATRRRNEFQRELPRLEIAAIYTSGA
jgi:hypothetical protein